MYSWWEKTVEYKFVVEASSKELCDFAAPMAGIHERTAGDAIFGKDTLLVLVEFKRQIRDIPTEEALFHNYTDAKKLLQGFKHHHIVFGTLTAGDPVSFKLWARRYFIEGKYVPALEILKAGATKDAFDKYITDLAAQKVEDGRGSGHVSPEGMSTVLGVTTDGQLVGAVRLNEYSPQLYPAPKPLPVPPPTLRPRP